MTLESLHVDLPSGAVEIPYVDVRGPEPGPHLTLISGVHGTEYTSIAANREFAAGLESAVKRGRVTSVPIVNLGAFWARTPFVVPGDGKNLNRSFPGSPSGSDAEVLAAALTAAFIEPTDYLIDLHCGDLPEALAPFSLYDESPVEDAARELALVYGLPHLVRQSSAGRTVGGSTSAVAADLGKPAITAESGQQGVLDRPSVELHLAGLWNVVRHLGIAEGSRHDPGRIAEYDGWTWPRTPVAGWWEPVVSVGDSVDEGDLVGTVSEILGGVVHEVRATQPCVPIFLTSSPAVQTDGLLAGLAHPAS